MKPRFFSVQYHPAYEANSTNRTVKYYPASMTALDSEGCVWRTYISSEGWQPWKPLNTFEGIEE